MVISGTTKIFVIFAHPSEQVRAPTLFNQRFHEKGIDNIMIPIDVPPSNLKICIQSLRSILNFRGGVVTIPHKIELAKLCDKLGPGARATGAVNAVRFDDDGTLHGDNFDGVGFVAGLKEHKHVLKNKQILLVGAGGASRAIAAELVNEPIGSLKITNRTYNKAKEVVKIVKSVRETDRIECLKTDQIDYSIFDIVINATSLGLKVTDPMPFDVELLCRNCVVCDIIMKPEETALLIAAKKAGLSIHYGKHMLDYQISFIADFIGAFRA